MTAFETHTPGRSLPILNDYGLSDPDLSDLGLGDIEKELAELEARERERLGLETPKQWVEDMAGLTFTKKERGNITMLLGGLTMAHDMLIEGALSAIGYKMKALDVPDNAAFQAGKEFGNRAQCNPTYFTVGNLVKHLIRLRDVEKIPTQKIIDDYVFITAGACGPCRFGMYTTEYRKALRDAGFDGFRVVLFQQQGGFNQATGEESGLELTPPFFVALASAVLAGDVINGMGYRLRPFEVEPGATDRAVEEAKRLCYDAFKAGRSVLWALWKARQVFAQVKVDRTRACPKVAIIGEFWAMTTEGDGNYELQRFLQREGAECDIQFVAAWLLYNIWEVRWDTANRAELRGVDAGAKGLHEMGEFDVFKRRVTLAFADKALRVVFQTFAHAVGFEGYKLPDMNEVARVAAPHYNNDLRGGEGHMEVGKLILNVVHNKATMTLSVKPFGCMPSSAVSDGVQSLITEKYPGTIFCPVETSGDGAVNFQSRVQMYLFKARQALTNEMEKALAETGLTLEQVRRYVADHPRLAHSLHKPAHFGSATPVDVIYEVADHMETTRASRLLRRVKGLVRGARAAARKAPATARELASLGGQGARELATLGAERVRERVRGASAGEERRPAA